MNKRRRFKAKSRRHARRRSLERLRLLRFHPDAFSMVWPMRPTVDVIYGIGYVRCGTNENGEIVIDRIGPEN